MAVRDHRPGRALPLAGTTRRRPPPRSPGAGRPPGRPTAGTVELQIPRGSAGRTLAADPPPGWLGTADADLAAQYARRDQLLAELDSRPASGSRTPRWVPLHRGPGLHSRSFPATPTGPQDPAGPHPRPLATAATPSPATSAPLCVLHHALKTAGRWQLRQPALECSTGAALWDVHLPTRGEPVCVPCLDPLPRPHLRAQDEHRSRRRSRPNARSTSNPSIPSAPPPMRRSD
ncbi:hypothetical protein HBB16_14405 [Pseudonocardia sp. MCCB 268]|nr:hypothetical protein [Pseudonocardia cytotoxica]